MNTLGIDIGGTNVKLILADEEGKILRRKRISCGPHLPWEQIVDHVAREVIHLAGERPLRGVGVGCAGCVDAARGIIRFSPNLPLWKEVPLKEALEQRLGVPCVVDNDVNMMAWGEYRFGAGRGARALFCVTVGTGVGGALIINGSLYRGTTMSAGEIGHVPVEPEGLPCPCGSRGCLERYVGAEGLAALAQRMMKGKRSALHGRKDLTPLVLEECAKAGDAVANEVWERAGWYLGLALAGVVNLLNPDVIVIGGGIAKAGRVLLQPLRHTVKVRALPLPVKHVKIVRSRLGAYAGALGGASEVGERED